MLQCQRHHYESIMWCDAFGELASSSVRSFLWFFFFIFCFTIYRVASENIAIIESDCSEAIVCTSTPPFGAISVLHIADRHTIRIFPMPPRRKLSLILSIASGRLTSRNKVEPIRNNDRSMVLTVVACKQDVLRIILTQLRIVRQWNVDYYFSTAHKKYICMRFRCWASDRKLLKAKESPHQSFMCCDSSHYYQMHKNKGIFSRLAEPCGTWSKIHKWINKKWSFHIFGNIFASSVIGVYSDQTSVYGNARQNKYTFRPAL